MAFADQVRAVLSDTLNLPDDFLSMIPQYVAQNPVALARTAGTRIASGSKTANVATVGVNFAAGADILASPLTFTADGSTDYVLIVKASAWFNSGANGQELNVNLDGAGNCRFLFLTSAGAPQQFPCVGGGLIVKPAAGSHTVNARLITNAGTATILGGVGGAGNVSPIIVTLEVA